MSDATKHRKTHSEDTPIQTATPEGDDEFYYRREQSHHLYDKQRLHYLQRLVRPAIGTLFVAALATVVFKSPPPVVGETPSVSAAGPGAIDSQQADREDAQLDPLSRRLEPCDDQHR